jgi:hypothetical protein
LRKGPLVKIREEREGRHRCGERGRAESNESHRIDSGSAVPVEFDLAYFAAKELFPAEVSAFMQFSAHWGSPAWEQGRERASLRRATP